MKGKSPYAKKNKKPHRYSSLYYEWRAALMGGDSNKVRELSEQHTLRYAGRLPVKYQP